MKKFNVLTVVVYSVFFCMNVNALSPVSAVRIDFAANGVVIDNPLVSSGVTVTNTGGHILVNAINAGAETVFVLSGAASNGSVTVYSNNAATVVLSSLSLINPNGAAVTIQSTKTITLTLTNGTINRISSGAAKKAAFLAKGNIIVTENGALDIRSDSVGIEIDGILTITGGNININTTGEKGHGIKVSGIMNVNSTGTIAVTVSGNGSKGFSAKSDFILNKGAITLNTSGNAFWEAADSDITSPAGIKCDGILTINGGRLTIASTGTGGKGISVDGDLNINGGMVNVSTTGGQYVYDRNNDTAAKAIKSDSNLTVTGGTIVIRTYGFEAEGLESKKVLTITGGDIDIEAYDDCINASNHIQIDGGRIYCLSQTNDGIDSNGTLSITGGFIVSAGASGMEEGFDCDQSRFSITGGTLIGIGGATSSPTASACTQCSVIFSTATPNVAVIRIETVVGAKEVLTFKMPRIYSQRMTLLFSSPSIESGTEYVIYTGGNISSGTDFHGLFSGAVYTKGTNVGNFTTNSLVSGVGNTGGRMGPGGGMGRR
ncbi:hypothetical protein FACS1894172_04180 [Spirochaetia bacterium]|nr:hypothetical protein FACS1894164_07160 [Spirochaetia bacterium]GHU30616.1 hypothetical protein FACS1894172_04180 [Spirochaetia bacterium]